MRIFAAIPRETMERRQINGENVPFTCARLAPLLFQMSLFVGLIRLTDERIALRG